LFVCLFVFISAEEKLSHFRFIRENGNLRTMMTLKKKERRVTVEETGAGAGEYMN
jgi:hypothetical protein